MVKGRTRMYLMGGVFVAMLLGIFSRPAKATNVDMFVDSNLTVSFPSLIVIDTVPNYSGLQTANASLKVSTNNENGYLTIFSVIGSKNSPTDTSVTNLKNTSENASIPTLVEQRTKAAFPVGYWGYSLDNGENYRGITAYNDPNRLVISSPQAGAVDVTDFTFGVRVDGSQPVGLYSNTLLITTVANVEDIPEPASFSAKALYLDNGHLSFVYDNNEYHVGDTHVTEFTSSAIQSIYNVPQDATDYPYLVLGWRGANGEYPTITALDFEESFRVFTPLRTNEWFRDLSSLKDINGIENFNTSQVTSMAGMFAGSFTSGGNWAANIGNLDVSNVQDLNSFFQSVNGSNASTALDLSNWDTGNATALSYMFAYSGTWPKGVVGFENFDTRNVKYFGSMFEGSYVNSEIDLSTWNTSSAIDMYSMFNSPKGNIKITFGSGWDLSHVTSISYMFYDSYTDGPRTFTLVDASNWRLDSVSSVYSAFGNAGLVADIHGWDFSRNTQLGTSGLNSMFQSSSGEFRVDASDWVLPSSITSLYGFFREVGQRGVDWTLDISGWNVGNITDMSYMLYNTGNCGWNLDVSGWDTSNVKNMSYLFANSAPNNGGGKIGYYSQSLPECRINVVGTETWDTSEVTNMSHIFYRFGGSQYRDFNYYLSYYNDRYGFYNSVIAYSPSKFNIGIDSWTTDKVTNMNYAFAGTTLTESFANTMKNWNTSSFTNIDQMFYCSLVDGEELDLSGWDVDQFTSMAYLFNGLSGANLTLNISGWDTSNVTDMSYMFGNYSNIGGYSYGNDGFKTVPAHIRQIIGIEGLDVHNVTSFDHTFAGLRSRVAILDLTDWDVSKATNVSRMFEDMGFAGNNDGHGSTVTEAVLNLEGWDLGLVTYNSNSMFNSFGVHNSSSYGGHGDDWRYGQDDFDYRNLTALRLKLGGMNVSNMRDMSYMFSKIGRFGNNELTIVIEGLEDWDVSKVTSMAHMFDEAEFTTMSLDLTAWNTSSVQDMSYMFNSFGGWYARSITIDMSNLNTSNVYTMEAMFNDSGVSASVFDVDISGWDVSNVQYHDNFVTRLMLEPHWVY